MSYNIAIIHCQCPQMGQMASIVWFVVSDILQKELRNCIFSYWKTTRGRISCSLEHKLYATLNVNTPNMPYILATSLYIHKKSMHNITIKPTDFVFFLLAVDDGGSLTQNGNGLRFKQKRLRRSRPMLNNNTVIGALLFKHTKSFRQCHFFSFEIPCAGISQRSPPNNPEPENHLYRFGLPIYVPLVWLTLFTGICQIDGLFGSRSTPRTA